MRGCSVCRPRHTRAKTSSPRISRRPRDTARLGPLCGDGRHLGHPLPLDQDRGRRADAREPGPAPNGGRRSPVAAHPRPPRLAHPPSPPLALGGRLPPRLGVRAVGAAPPPGAAGQPLAPPPPGPPPPP